jgi:hypothetical protein
LASEQDFMRIDFLLSDEGLVFTEWTPYPNGGRMWWWSPLGHAAVDRMLGRTWERAQQEIVPHSHHYIADVEEPGDANLNGDGSRH